MSELSETEIAAIYKKESVEGKIRSKICKCGERVDWDELKAKFDHVLNDYLGGKDTLLQTDT